MTDLRSSCSRFRSLLAPSLERDLGEEDAAWFLAHSSACPPCAERERAAREADACIARWEAPEPPRGFAERALADARALAAGAEVACDTFRADLELWLSGDATAAAAKALSLHARICPPCGLERLAAERTAALLRAWRAPEPAPEFADRVVALHLAESAPAERLQLARRRAPTRFALAAAAALLGAAVLGFLRGSDPPPPAGFDAWPVQVQRVRLIAVAADQFPGGIGTFAAQPVAADQLRGRSGGAFRRALADAIAARPIPPAAIRRESR